MTRPKRVGIISNTNVTNGNDDVFLAVDLAEPEHHRDVAHILLRLPRPISRVARREVVNGAEIPLAPTVNLLNAMAAAPLSTSGIIALRIPRAKDVEVHQVPREVPELEKVVAISACSRKDPYTAL